MFFTSLEVLVAQHLTGLTSFCIDYPEAIPLLLYRGKERLKKNNILCMPIEEFLLGLNPLGELQERSN